MDETGFCVTLFIRARQRGVDGNGLDELHIWGARHPLNTPPIFPHIPRTAHDNTTLADDARNDCYDADFDWERALRVAKPILLAHLCLVVAVRISVNPASHVTLPRP